MKALLLLLLLVLFGCEGTQTPQEPVQVPVQEPAQKACPVCDDSNPCTSDICGPETGYACQYTAIKPCCGDSVCEQGEAGCADCPECKAAACQKAEYDYALQKCVNSNIVPCCGNAICEEGELGTCPDCPKCETTDSCKTAKYSYETNTCNIKPIIPCCGNEICDRGETCSGCEKDCGECEDELDLADYPDFLDDGTIIVVGDEAKSQDSFTASMLATNLLTEGVDTESGIYSMLKKSELDSEDLIVLGRPCENEAWEEYLGVECGTDDYFEPGTAIIKLALEGGREILFVGGSSPQETERAAERLLEGRLSGTEVELD
jgi:hypothetical protein